MIKSTFHSHSRFDDGQEELEAYIESALAKGFSVFGFSGHAPLIFNSVWNMKQEYLEEYLQTANSLKEKYKNQIQIYTGLETDFYPGCTDWRNKYGLDYTIGAVHFIKNEETGKYMPIDGSREEFENTLSDYDHDIHALFMDYFEKIREMLLKMPPNIIAHLDVIRKNNAGNIYFREDDKIYQDEILKTLEIISLTDTIVEINTGGIARGYLTEPYPSRWILENCYDMGIHIMLNSDCHHPENIDFHYNESYAMLRDIGFKKQRILYNNEWHDVSL